MNEMFLDILPKKHGVGVAKEVEVIDWTKSIGKKVPFNYQNIKGKIEILDYKKETNRLCVRCENGNTFEILTDSFRACQLGRKLGKITSDFKITLGQMFKDEKKDLIIIDREHREKTRVKRIKDKEYKYIEKGKYYRYKCNICSYNEGWMMESALLRGDGCSCCRGITVVEGVNDVPTTAPWMVKYFKGGYDEAKLYTKSSSKRIRFICPNCGQVKSNKIRIADAYKEQSIGCKKCGDGISYPNKVCYTLLKQLKVEFKTEYSPKWISPKRYDFYFKVDNKKYILEADGGFHYEDNRLSGQAKEETKAIDKYKEQLAKEHGIQVIRIDCAESDLKYIKKNILNSKLNELFDLSSIDWLMVEEFSLGSLIRMACKIKKDNPNITATDISRTMKISQVTVIEYLKKGDKLGWCNYNPKNERRKGGIKGGKKLGKKVEIFKNDTSLGVFESVADLGRKSEKIFGVKLSDKSISSVCTKKRNHHKGYTFKYV